MKQFHSLSDGHRVTVAARANLPRPFHMTAQPFQAPRRRLRGPVPLSFEAFYRSNLRFVSAARLKSIDVTRFYEAWAMATGSPAMSAKAMKQAMRHIGHRAVRSNGIWYTDLAIAAEHPDVLDNYPALPSPVEAQTDAIADRLDAMITELTQIRSAIYGASPAQA